MNKTYIELIKQLCATVPPGDDLDAAIAALLASRDSAARGVREGNVRFSINDRTFSRRVGRDVVSYEQVVRAVYPKAIAVGAFRIVRRPASGAPDEILRPNADFYVREGDRFSVRPVDNGVRIFVNGRVRTVRTSRLDYASFTRAFRDLDDLIVTYSDGERRGALSPEGGGVRICENMTFAVYGKSRKAA